MLAIVASGTGPPVVIPPTLGALSLAVRGNVLQVGSNANAFWCIYSGGVGPYTFSFRAGAGQTLSSPSGPITTASGRSFFMNPTTGFCTASYAGSTADTTPDVLTLAITDNTGLTVTATYSQTYVSGPVILLTQDFLLTNVPAGPQAFIGISPFLTGFTSAAVTTYSEPSGLLTVQWVGVGGGYIFGANNVWPPPGVYPVTLTVTQGSLTYSQTVQVHIVAETGPTSITFTPAPILSTSLPPGFVVGQAEAGGDLDNQYAWSISGPGTAFYVVSSAGLVTLLAAPPAAGVYPITLVCADLNAAYQQTFDVTFVAGIVIASANMTAALPSGLTNAISSGVLSTPTVTGFVPTQWLLLGSYGVGTRYAINPAMGATNIIGALSYQVAADGTDFSDVLTWVATDGIKTCSLTQPIPVAAAVGPTIHIGPADLLAAAGVTGTTYPNLTAAFNALGTQEPGIITTIIPGTVFVCHSYPQTDARYKTYFFNDGINFDHGYGAGGLQTEQVPITIKGAPGGPFPYFTATVGAIAKGFFGATKFDLVLANLTVAGITRGDGYGNLCGIYKEAGSSTGNLTIDNCYVHDCDDGIARGCPGSKILITNTRVSHCGVGSRGLTHNIYIECDEVFLSNCLSDQSFCGHLLKSRSQSTTINNLRLIDGQLGSASNIIDLPHGGLSTIAGSFLHKSPNGQNPFVIKFADPNDQANFLGASGSGRHNVLTVTNNTFLLDPGEPGLGNVMPGMNTSNAGQAEVFAIVNASYPGTADGLPASVTGTGNSFFGVAPDNETLILDTQGAVTIAAGTVNVTGSTMIAAAGRPPLDFSFPGPGPDPTLLDPAGPHLQTWLGGVGGGQIVAPVDIMPMLVGAPPGVAVGTVSWSAGNTAIISPSFAFNYQSGPNAFAIDQNSGTITTTATPVAQTGQADVLGVTISGGGQEYIWNLAAAAKYPSLYATDSNAGVGLEVAKFSASLLNQTILTGASFSISNTDALRGGDFSEMLSKIALLPPGFEMHIAMPFSNLLSGVTYPFATRTITVAYLGANHPMIVPVITDAAFQAYAVETWQMLRNWMKANGFDGRWKAANLCLISGAPYDGEQVIPNDVNAASPQAEIAAWNALNVTEASANQALANFGAAVAPVLSGKRLVLVRFAPYLTMVGQIGDNGASSLSLAQMMTPAIAGAGGAYTQFDQTIGVARRAVVDAATGAVGRFAGQINTGSTDAASILTCFANGLYNPGVEWIELQPGDVPVIQALLYPA